MVRRARRPVPYRRIPSRRGREITPMSDRVRISLDAMGGDHGPATVVPGAAIARERHPGMTFLMFGDEAVLAPLVAAEPRLKDCVEIRHTTVAIAMDDKPSQAVRQGRGKSSMWQAIQAVRDGQAEACVSAGNTGALMAMSKICLKTMSGSSARPSPACGPPCAVRASSSMSARPSAPMPSTSSRWR